MKLSICLCTLFLFISQDYQRHTRGVVADRQRMGSILKPEMGAGKEKVVEIERTMKGIHLVKNGRHSYNFVFMSGEG